MKTFVIKAMAAAAVFAASACATEPQGSMEPPAFVVLEPNASISSANLIMDRGWARDDSIVLRTNSDNWYRATLRPGCTEQWGGAAIGFYSRSGTIIDRTSEAIINGQRCAFASFDKIAEPPEGSRR